MKKLLIIGLISFSFVLGGCLKQEVTPIVKTGSIEKIKTNEYKSGATKETSIGIISEDGIKNNLDIETLLQKSPYKELYEFKKWKPTKLPTANYDEFMTKSGTTISIKYIGNPYVGGKTTLVINNTEIIDTSDCLKWQNKEGDFAEDEPIFVRADCKKYYHGFSINGKEVEYDFQNSMADIWISKNESKVAIFGGKLIVDFENGTYVLNKKYLDLEKMDYILLKRVY